MCLTRAATEFDSRIERDEEIRVFELSQGRFAHALVAAELALDFFEVVGREVSHRDGRELLLHGGKNLRAVQQTSTSLTTSAFADVARTRNP